MPRKPKRKSVKVIEAELDREEKELNKRQAALKLKRAALEKRKFVEHLERASKIVSTWPVWKQRLLG